MASPAIIDVESRYTDKASAGMAKTGQNADKTADKMAKIQKTLDKLGVGKVVKIEAMDNASKKVQSVIKATEKFASKTYKGVVKIVDYATKPIRAITNSLFSLKGLMAAVATGFAANKLVVEPIAKADKLEAASIAFETMFKSADKAQSMIKEIQDFAAKTPFDTTGVVSSVQQMIRAGWDAKDVMKDMEKIGNAASAAGQGTEGVQGIVYALQQMKMSGRLYAQDMFQLTNRGVAAWKYVAEGIGKSVPETRKLAENGLIPIDKAIQSIIDGMGEYDGMMEKMSNRTVSGLMSNLRDTFDIKVVNKWGRGLADGATKGLGKFADWLDKIDPALQKAGTSLQDLGEKASNFVFGKLENAGKKLMDVIGSVDFKNASIGGKIKILWDEMIVDPFQEWWEGTGRKAIAKAMNSVGKGMGSFLGTTIKMFLGIDIDDASKEGSSIGASFAQGFKDGFKAGEIGKAIKEAFGNAFKSAFKILPGGESPDAGSWVSSALLAYGGMKIGKGVVGAGKTLGLGKAASAVAGGNLIEKYGMRAIGMGSGNLAGGASMGNMALAGLGFGSTAGAVIGGTSTIAAVNDIYTSFKTDDKAEKKQKGWRGGTKLALNGGGAAAGAAIGAMFGGVGAIPGALIGWGIGGLTAMLGGNKLADSISGVTDKTVAASKASKELQKSEEELAREHVIAQKRMEELKQVKLQEYFGDVALSAEEISGLVDNVIPSSMVKSAKELATAYEAVNNKLETFRSSETDIKKWMVKGELGLDLSEDGNHTAFNDAVYKYIENAKAYLKEDQITVNMGLKILFEGTENSPDQERIQNSINQLYKTYQEKINNIGKEYEAELNVALKDGVITMDEQTELMNLQTQISNIIEKMADAEFEATLDVIKIKYGSGEIDKKTRDQLFTQLEESLNLTKGEHEKNLTMQLSKLRVMIDNPEFNYTEEDYTKDKEALSKQYSEKIGDIEAKVTNFKLKIDSDAIIQGATGDIEKVSNSIKETLNGKDFLGDLNAADKGEIYGKDKKGTTDWNKWLNDKMNLEGLRTESATALKTMEDLAADYTAAGKSIPESLSKGIEEGSKLLNLMGGEDGEGGMADLWKQVEGVSKDKSYTAALESMKTAGLEVPKKLGEGMSGQEALNKFTADAGTLYTNVQTLLQGKFDTPIQANAKVLINATVETTGTGAAILPKLPNWQSMIGWNAKGNIINRKQLSWVGEEGPEAIIPLVSGRRNRGIELWEKTGKMLGIPGYATGGIIGINEPYSTTSYSGSINTRNISETINNGRSVSPVVQSQSGSPPIQIGNITFEIKTNGNSLDLVQAVKDQAGEITDTVAAILLEVLGTKYQNTPLKGRA